MLWIGLTGGIASGKSTVAKHLGALGYRVISADSLSHQAMSVGTVASGKIRARFGGDVFLSDGSVDRAKLGTLVFQDSTGASKRDLENILHPEVRRMAAAERDSCERAGQTMAFYEIPLLFEKNLASQFDKVVCVAVTPELQVERLMERSKLDRQAAQSRIQSQLPQADKVAASDFVIWNNGSVEDLKTATEDLVRKLHQP